MKLKMEAITVKGVLKPKPDVMDRLDKTYKAEGTEGYHLKIKKLQLLFAIMPDGLTA